MSDDAFTWMNDGPTTERATARNHADSPTSTRRVKRHRAGGETNTVAELRARLAAMQARLEMLEGNVEAWNQLAGWLPASGVRMLAAWRGRSPAGNRRERAIRVIDIAGSHLENDSRRAPRVLGRGLRALAGALRTRAAA